MNPLVQSPSNPQLASPTDANLPNSGGFEGMALDARGTRLYALLEKPLNGDPVRNRLLIHEFSLKARAYTGKTWGYLMDTPDNAIGDLTALSDREFLVIERDNGQGNASDPRFTQPARFKKIFKVDLDSADAEGNLAKVEIADLLNIYDPRDVAGDGRTSTVFTFPIRDHRGRARGRQRRATGSQRQQLSVLRRAGIRPRRQRRVHPDPHRAAPSRRGLRSRREPPQ